jgi:hypothetical protein
MDNQTKLELINANDKVIKEKLTGDKEEKKPFNLKEWLIALYYNHTKTTVATVVVIAFWIFLGFKYQQ